MPFLDWVNKSQATNSAAQVPYHLLQFQSVHGFDSAQPPIDSPQPLIDSPLLPGFVPSKESSLSGAEGKVYDNLLIQGDNLLALKALLPFYRGRVKCIYIDPPYNTQSAFTHYDDKLEHSQWLSLMYPRLVMLRELLADDGSIWVSIDDNEAHYLKVLLDELFGRSNFLCGIAWEKRYSPPPDTKEFGYVHDLVLCYRKSADFRRNLLPLTDDQTGRYTNKDNDSRGPWKAMDYTCRYSADERPNLNYPILQPNTGEEIWPKRTRVWAMSREVHERNVSENRLWWGTKGTNSVPALKNFISEINQGMMPMSLWKYTLAGHTQDAMKEMLALFGEEPFSTPKPEKLIHTIFHIATNPGDLVLDSFLGSGTTAAVAHKMGRRWIGIEMGEHAVTHCLPRLEKVVGGEQGGISKAVEWQGGGGFRFHTLGEPVFDADGGIHQSVRFAALAGYLWHFETGEPWGSTPLTHLSAPHNQQPIPLTHRSLSGVEGNKATPLLGTHNNTAYYLLYNGILGDRRPQGGNVLTSAILSYLEQAYPHHGPRTIYGETTRLGEARLREAGISFKQIPYDIKAR